MYHIKYYEDYSTNESVKSWLATYLLMLNLGLVPSDLKSADNNDKKEFIESQPKLKLDSIIFQKYYQERGDDPFDIWQYLTKSSIIDSKYNDIISYIRQNMNSDSLKSQEIEISEVSKVGYNKSKKISKINGIDLEFKTKKEPPKKLGVTIAYSFSTSDGVPLGALVGLHSNKFSMYFDIKGFQNNFIGPAELYYGPDVRSWSEETILSQYQYTSEIYPGSFENGSYRTTYKKETFQEGTFDHKRKILSLGIGYNRSSRGLKGLVYQYRLGVGLVDINRASIAKVTNTWWTNTRYNVIGVYDFGDIYRSSVYKIQKIEKVTEISINGGVIFNFGPIHIGVGYQSNPSGLDFSLGWSFGRSWD